MKRSSNIIWGIVLVAIGLVLGLNEMGITTINLFFDGWWTLIWIIPCFVGLFKNKDKTANLIGIAIGVAILLACQGIINLKLLWKLLVPCAIVLIGLSLIFKDTFNKKTKDAIKKLNEKSANSSESINAIFSSQEVSYEHRTFGGNELNAIFGGIELNLKDALINEDVVINANAIFGGIDIIAPDYVNVKISSTSIFGGVSDERKVKCKDGTATLYINALCLFGGTDVK